MDKFGHLILFATVRNGCAFGFCSAVRTKVDLWRFSDGLWASSVLAEEPLDLKVLEGKEFGAGDLGTSADRMDRYDRLGWSTGAMDFIGFPRLGLGLH